MGQKVWDYETGLKVARGLQDAGADWLEEPFARDDYDSPARLAREWTCRSPAAKATSGLDGFRECVMHKTYDILQPEGSGCGGILTCVKVAPWPRRSASPVSCTARCRSASPAGSRRRWPSARPGRSSPWYASAVARGTVVAGAEGPEEPEGLQLENGELLAPPYSGDWAGC